MDTILKKRIVTVKKEVPAIVINLSAHEAEIMHTELHGLKTLGSRDLLRQLYESLGKYGNQLGAQDKVMETIVGDIH